MTKKELRVKVETVLVRKDKVGMNAVGRALVHLKNRQTEDEQRSCDTKVHNSMGFQPCHAFVGTKMAMWYEEKGFLTPKQVDYWQNDDNKLGKARISRYWKQLVEEAELKIERNKQ